MHFVFILSKLFTYILDALAKNIDIELRDIKGPLINTFNVSNWIPSNYQFILEKQQDIELSFELYEKIYKFKLEPSKIYKTENVYSYHGKLTFPIEKDGANFVFFFHEYL